MSRCGAVPGASPITGRPYKKMRCQKEPGHEGEHWFMYGNKRVTWDA